MNKKLFLCILVLALTFLFVPKSSLAITADELQAQISNLLSQIAQLQKQLAGLQGAKPWCYDFNVNLKIGDSGNEVSALQMALTKEFGSPAGNMDNAFDEFTASNVVGFQEKYRDEILTPLGLKHGTGFVGPATRAKLNKLYGCGIIKPSCPQFVSPISGWCKNGKIVSGGYDENGCISPPKCVLSTENLPPVISGVSGPTQLKVSETGNWTVKASDPEQGILTYSVVWGDETTGSAFAPTSKSSTYTQTTTFTHSYSKSGDYTIAFVVKDAQGKEAKTTITVKILSETIACTDSDGGKEYYLKGNVAEINQYTNWQSNIYPDMCVSDTPFGNLAEAICEKRADGYYYGSQIYYTCLYGCQDGACVAAPTPSITVLSPTSGTSNDMITIYGKNLVDTIPSGIKIELLKDGLHSGTIGTQHIFVQPDGLSLRFQLIGLLVENSEYRTYQIRVVNNNGNSNTVNFTIVAPSTPSITVISPNGGEVWEVGKTYIIKWNTTLDSSKIIQIGLIDVRYSTETGPRGEATIIHSTPNTGGYGWTVPKMLGTMDLTDTIQAVYKVKLYIDGGGSGKFDESDTPLSIVVTSS